jgi:hypothetical protein
MSATRVIAHTKGTLMTAIENVTQVEIRSRREAGLVVEASDISFEDLTRDRVMVHVQIRNDGEHRSSPTIMRLESALFGAFVPSQPLAVLSVPPLEPGESRVLSVEAERPHPKPLGDFDRVPPKDVLTALSASPDESSRQGDTGISSLRRFFQRSSPRQKAPTTAKGRTLQPDLWEMFGREQPHWAGNINVFVGDRAVERHVAKALRIYAGRTNLAMFVVGDPRRHDAYAFDLVGLAPDWKASLYDQSMHRNLVVGPADKPIQEKHWVESAAPMMLVMLAVRPPVVCEDGNLQVQVTRRSTQQTAIVEFNLNPTAQGPGCYIA